MMLKEGQNSSVLSNIDIRERLGSGNFGEVFRGIWLSQGVAIDIALKRLKSREQFKEFVDEVATLRRFDHPNIVKFLGVFVSTTGDNYIVTEYCSGGSLLDILQKDRKMNYITKLHLYDVTYIITNVIFRALQGAKGMLYLEEMKIVHRDCSCRNFLVHKTPDEAYLVKVSDFGMSKFVESYYIACQGNVAVHVSGTNNLI